MRKIIASSMMALAFVACTENQDSTSIQGANESSQGAVAANESTETTTDEGQTVTYTKNDGISLWKHMNEEGGTDYFEQEGVLPNEWFTSQHRIECENGLKMDSKTILLDEMEGIYREGTLVDGVCGKAVSLKSGEVAPLSLNMNFPLEKGTVEFMFRPGVDFYSENARTLLGNDEARVHFFVKDGKIIFQKNHADKHFYVIGDFHLQDGWNKIAGQWGDGYMSIWINDSLVAKKEHALGYEPSTRENHPLGNLLVIGYKSYCCMEGPGQHSPMTTSGDYDQIRVSNDIRYYNDPLAKSSSENTDTLFTVESSSSEVTIEIVETSSSENSTEFIETSSSEDSTEFIETSSSIDSTEFIETSSSIDSTEFIESSSSIDSTEFIESSSSIDSTEFIESSSSVDEFLLWEDFDQDKNYSITLTEGISGKAGTFNGSADKMILESLDKPLSQGTIQFYFKPNADFENQPNAALVGSDEGRLTIQKTNGQYFFFKNLDNEKIYTYGYAKLVDGWNKFAGQWDGNSISLYINDKLIATTSTNSSYKPSTRSSVLAPYGNAILVGYKDDCCTSGYNVYAYGDFDNIMVTTELLYNK